MKDITINGFLAPFHQLKKWVTIGSKGRLALYNSEYRILLDYLCEYNGKIKTSITKEIKGERNPSQLNVSLVINDYLCIFTDASDYISLKLNLISSSLRAMS